MASSPYSPATNTSAHSLLTRHHTTYDQSLSSFAPEILKHILANEGNQIEVPYVKTFQAVGVFADVSGFTNASEKLSEMGNLGTEMLAHKINAYLPHIAKKIVAAGGDVVKFAGDALVCMWPPPPDTLFNEYERQYKKLEKKHRKYENIKKSTLNAKNLSKLNELNTKFEDIKKKYCLRKAENEKLQKEASLQSARSAVQCAIQIQQEYKRMDLAGSYYNGIQYNGAKKKNKKARAREKIEFRVKLGVGIGKIHLLIVGGNLSRCEYLICGDALIQAFDCENDAAPDQDRMIIISEQVHNVEGMRENFEMKKVKNSNHDLNNYFVLGVNKMSRLRTKIQRNRYDHIIPDEQNELAELLTSYVPAAVKPHLDMQQQIWTGELREVTIMFISLPWDARSLAKVTNTVLQQLQDIIYLLQSVIYKFQGSLNKFLVDDKGSTVMAVFGLPPVAHQNDPARAVLAALELRERIGGNPEPAAIGLSTGTVFVGIIGSKGVRREYGILGDKVNLSARLMGLSKKNPTKLGEVICDQSVYIRARKEIRIEWTDLKLTKVKGKDNKVHIWRPSKVNIPISAYKIGQAAYLETSDKTSIKNINYEIEQYFKNKKQGRGRVILIEGEIGIGKTSLLGQIQVQNSRKLWFLWGKANEFHETHPNMKYIVWKQIMLGYSSRYSLLASKNRYLLKKWIKQRRPDLLNWLFLINDILDLGDQSLLEPEFLPKSSQNRKKMKSVKKSTLINYRHDVILIILEWTARIKPIAIIIDELQYLCRNDWQITRRLCGLVHDGVLKNILVFLGSTEIDNQRYRPRFTDQKVIDKYSSIKTEHCNKVLRAASWSIDKTKFFIKKYFDVGDCSDRIIMTVHSQCGGRPGFCENFLSELTNDINKGHFVHIYPKMRLQSPRATTTTTKNGKQHRKTMNALSRTEMYCSFNEELDNRFRIGLDVSFPVPSYIYAITLTHLDKLTTEQAFVLKVGAVICKSKGNNSKQFDEHMIRGCHPLPNSSMNGRKRLRETLKTLCHIQFISKLNKKKKGMNDMLSNLTTLSQRTNLYDPTAGMSEDEEENLNYVDNTDFDGITDPMPSTKSLLQAPIRSVPYKKGAMYKRGVNFINMKEKKRVFVFKHRTLYWIQDVQKDEYPKGRIKFDQTVQKLKREDAKIVTINTPRKEFVLRTKKRKDMDAWFKLFSEALRENFLSNNLLKRMKLHSTTSDKQHKTNKNNKKQQQQKNGSVNNKKISIKLTTPSIEEEKTTSSVANNKSKHETITNGNTPKMQQTQNKIRECAASVVDVDYTQKNGNNNNLQNHPFQYKYVANMSVRLNNNKTPDDEDEDYDLDQFDDNNYPRGSTIYHPVDEQQDDEEYDLQEDTDDDDDDDDDDSVIDPEELEKDIVGVLKEQMSHFSAMEEAEADEDDEKSKSKKSDSASDLNRQISPELFVTFSSKRDRNAADNNEAESDEEYDCIGVQPGDSTYEFSYGFLRDITYDEMLFNQRKQLHTNAVKYIAKCLEEKNDDKLALLHTRNVECTQRYSAMLQGDDRRKTAFQPKRASFFNKMSK